MAILLSRRQITRVIDRIFLEVPNADMKHFVVHAELMGQFSECLARGNASITAAIIGLLAPCSPAAVLQRVRSIYVYAIKRVGWRWPWSDISDERFKTRRPFCAHFNTATAVLWVVLIVLI